MGIVAGSGTGRTLIESVSRLRIRNVIASLKPAAYVRPEDCYLRVAVCNDRWPARVGIGYTD